MIHEDPRITLIDWNDKLPIATVKTIIAKQDCELDNHYHKIKTERFMMLRGKIIYKLERDPWQPMTEGKPIKVNPGVTHAFKLTKGAILQCLTTHEYDKNDDYPDRRLSSRPYKG